jgi:hypothetical protein
VQAGVGIGSPAQPLATAIATLDATSGGGVYVSNAGDLIVSTSGFGDVTITTSGNLDLAGSVVAGGNASTLSLIAGQNLTMVRRNDRGGGRGSPQFGQARPRRRRRRACRPRVFRPAC